MASRRDIPPQGFIYQTNFLSDAEERNLVTRIGELRLKEFEFQGYLAKRRVISYGWQYDFNGDSLNETAELPAFLSNLRDRSAALAGIPAESLTHALVTEYRPNTPIGWHRDKAVFDEVIGVSLLSACTFRLRRKTGSRWERYSLTLEPRSVYVLRGEVRDQWEHSIPPVRDLRYSVTLRSLR